MATLATYRLIDMARRKLACQAIVDAPAGAIVTIREATRTLDQNAMLWPLLTDLSRQVEWPVNGTPQRLSKEEWKDIATASLRSEMRIAAGMDGGAVILGRRTSTMSKRMFSDLLEIIMAFGSAQGVVWTEPKERKAS